MPKYYIVPIDAQSRAYVGVKSVINPYTNNPWFCGGCPNLFGGNLQTSIANTLYMEAREESHYKMDLNQTFIDNRINPPIPPPPGLNGGFMQLLHVPGANGTAPMTFYAMRGHFQYDTTVFFPNMLANQPKYQETTGDIVMIDLTTVNRLSRQGAASDAILAMPLAARQLITPQRQAQFLLSETAEAIRLAAAAVFNNQI